MVKFRRTVMILDKFKVWGWANSSLDLTIMVWVSRTVMILDSFRFRVGLIQA